MNQSNIGPAGCTANIHHYRARVSEAETQLQQARNNLNFWVTVLKLKETTNGTGHTS